MNGEKEKLRKRLSKETELDEKDIEAILAAYAQQMAKLEHKIGVERARQIAVCSLVSQIMTLFFTNYVLNMKCCLSLYLQWNTHWKFQ